jgi:hypothetical protein
MLGLDVDFMMEKISQNDRRFGELANLAVELAQDKSMDSSARIDAVSVACEIEKQRIFLMMKGRTRITFEAARLPEECG